MKKVRLKQKYASPHIIFKMACLQIFLASLFVPFSFANATEKPNNSESSKSKSDVKKEVVIKGKVVDEKNEPLTGVSIVVKGSTKGTITDIDGNYSLTLDDNAESGQKTILVFSFISYLVLEVELGTQSEINVQLKPDTKELDEVVVVAYGTVKKRDLTGAVSVISPTEMKKVATNDIGQMMQGKAKGVAIKSDGQPGASPDITIRGLATFGDHQPLYIVDGIIIVTGIRDINPNDIESLQILKDASAVALYGSRAANGVVIITTKRGAKDQPLRVDYNMYYGVQNVTHKYSVTKRADYQMLNNETINNNTFVSPGLAPGNDPSSSSYITNIDTDWQKEALKQGTIMNHNIALSGGGKDGNYNVSFDYFKNTGLLKGNGPNYERFSFRVNSDMQKGKFKFGESAVITYSNENPVSRIQGFGGSNAPYYSDMLTAIPTMPVYDVTRDGGFGGTSSTIERAITLNVVGANSLYQSSVKVARFLVNSYGEYSFLDKANDKLKYKLSLNVDKTAVTDFSFQPTFDLGFFYQNAISKLWQNKRDYFTGLMEQTLTYDKIVGKHTLNLLVGNSFQTTEFQGIYGYSQNLPRPYFPVLDNGESKVVSGVNDEYRILSYFGRINYSYDDRYLVTLNARNDGSSKFSNKHRFGVFPSVAVAWKVHNEKFFKLPVFISNLKVRASYGLIGNTGPTNYGFQAYINPYSGYSFNNVNAGGSTQTQYANANMKWESKAMTNIGLDLGLFNNRIEFGVEYYASQINDLLVPIPIPQSSGSYDPVTLNSASIKNSGFEFDLTYRKSTGAFKFDINGNMYTLQNKVTKLGAYNSTPIYSTASITEVGSQVGQQYGYKVEGIFQSQEQVDAHAFQSAQTGPGDIIFKDLNGDGVINASDRTYLGNAIPNVYYGLNFNASYKNFDFTMNAFGSTGNKIIDFNYRALMPTSGYTNYSTDMLNRWTPTHTNTDVPRVIYNDPNGNDRDSDRNKWIQDGTYLRFQTVSLGYTVPTHILDKIKFISKLRVYSTIQNLYTITSYTGYNPAFSNSNIYSPGFDFGSTPVPRTVMFGAQVSF